MMTSEKTRDEWERDIVSQFEHYFSNQNLRKDRFLRDLMAKHAEQYVSIAVMADSPRIKVMNQELDFIVSALQKSLKLQISSDGKMIRRMSPVPEKAEEQKKVLDPAVQKEKRTIFCGNLPAGCGVDGIRTLFSRFGKIANIDLCDSKANTDPNTWQLVPSGDKPQNAPVVASASVATPAVAAASVTTPADPASALTSPTPTSALIEFETRNHAKKAVVSITTFNKKFKARKKSVPDVDTTGLTTAASAAPAAGTTGLNLGSLGVIVESEPDSPRERPSTTTTAMSTPPAAGSTSVNGTTRGSPEPSREGDDDEEEEEDEQEDDDEEVESLVPSSVDATGSQHSSHASTPEPHSKSPSPSPSTTAAPSKKQLDESYIGLWVMPKALFMKRLSKTNKEKKDKRAPSVRVKDHKSNSRTELNWRSAAGDGASDRDSDDVRKSDKDSDRSSRRSSLNANTNGRRRRSSTTPIQEEGEGEAARRSRNSSRTTGETDSSGGSANGRRSRAGSFGRESDMPGNEKGPSSRRGSGLAIVHNRNRSGGGTSPAAASGPPQRVKRASIVMQKMATGPPTADSRGFGRGRGRPLTSNGPAVPVTSSLGVGPGPAQGSLQTKPRKSIGAQT